MRGDRVQQIRRDQSLGGDQVERRLDTGEAARDGLLCREQVRDRRGADPLEIIGIDPRLFPQDSALLGRVRRLPHRHAQRRTLQDGPGEESTIAVGGQHGEQGIRAAGLSRGGDLGRVASECGDILADPGEGRDLVEQAHIAVADPRRCQVAERAEAIVHRDHDNVAESGEFAAVVPVESTGSGGESTTVQEYQDRVPGAGWRPDVQ
nr:hypothetical protein [Nocardia panacis]